MRFFDKFRKITQQEVEAQLIRETHILYWIVSPDRKHIKGPYLDVPRSPLGWVAVGYRADVFGRIVPRASYEDFDGYGSMSVEEKYCD